MNRLRSLLGYLVAVLSIPVILATFMAMEPLSQALVAATGVTISPWFTGNVVARTVDHAGYRTEIREPVFDALIGERKEGFVQIDWRPAEALPERIDEEIDVDGDGQADLRVALNAKTLDAKVTPYATWVLDLEGLYTPEDALAVRVRLRNPSR